MIIAPVGPKNRKYEFADVRLNISQSKREVLCHLSYSVVFSGMPGIDRIRSALLPGFRAFIAPIVCTITEKIMKVRKSVSNPILYTVEVSNCN